MNPSQGKKLFSWKFQEHEKPERSKSWFVALGVIAGTLLLFALISGNLVFGIIILLFVWISFLNYNKEPLMLDFSIHELGVSIEDNFIPFKELKEFWIVYEPPEVEKLYLKRDSLINPIFSVPLGGMDPLEVRELLLDFIDEDLDQDEESLEEGIARFLKL